jgi:hypothetical protein
VQGFAAEKFDALLPAGKSGKMPALRGSRVDAQAVRLLRDQVNFTSTLPRRGRVVACPICRAILPAELTNL